MKDDPAAAGLPPLMTRADFDTDDEHQEYLDIEAADLAPDAQTPALLAMWRSIGDAATPGSAGVVLALPEEDLRALRGRATAEGVPTDALIARVLHDWLVSR